MSRPTVLIKDAITGEEIIREMNDEEFEQFEIDQNDLAAKQAELQSKIQKKNAAIGKLNELGLTVEDLEALGL